MTFPLIQQSFIAGELSPGIFGRTDKAQFKNGASTMRNCFVSYRGGAVSRAGFAYVGMCKQAAPNFGGTATTNPPHDINFQYNINQGFALEFGDQYMRVKSKGAYVTEATFNISAANNQNPITITTSAPHGYNTGDWVYITGMGGMTNFNGLTWVITVTGTTTFVVSDLFGNQINSTSFSAYTSGGTVARIYTVVAPYAAIDLPYLKFTQSANIMNLVCWNQQTNTEYPPYNLQRVSNTDWTFTEASFNQLISPPASIGVAATSSTTLDTWYSYVVTAVDANNNESVASVNGDVQNNNISIFAGSNTVTWPSVSNAVQYNVYAAIPLYNTSATDPGFIGVQYGLIGTSFGLQFIDTNITPDFTTTPPQHLNPFARGAIATVTPTAGGSGLSQATVGYSITTSTGSGFSGTPIIQSGFLSGFIINDEGENYANTDTMAITGSAGVAATGTYTFTTNPTNNQTIILNGVTWTFKTSGATGTQTNIQATVQATVYQLVTDLTNSANGSIDVANYSASGLVVRITYGSVGTAGNAYTLAAGTYGGAVSGATLTGGLAVSGSGGATVSLTIGPQSGTYPGAIQYFQQRLVYADTINQPDTYFMSQPGLYSNFDSSIPVIDSDSITGTPWGVQINGIQFMVPSIQGLLTFTGNGVWLINGGNSVAITPSDENAQAQAQIGCSALIPPLYINLHVLYVQAKNSIVRDISFSFLYNVFQGTDITVFSNHLFSGYTLLQWAYAEEPFKVIWAVRNDGALLSLTYIKEQEVEGWSRHDTNGMFVGVCSVIEPPVDAIYVITKRYIVGEGVWVYYSERADDRQWNNVEDCFCVDAGLSLPMTFPNATLYPAAADGTNNISGTKLISGGTGYTDPVAFALDSTGFGNGANFTVSISGGVITAVVPSSEGQDYTSGATQIVITDPTGTGAVVQPVITNNVTFTASANVFTPAMIGDVIRADGGKATIVSVAASGTSMVANITQPLTTLTPNDPNNMPVPVLSGDWSVATPISTVNGLNHLNGMTVTGLADGGVIVPQVVANGSITLQNPASAITVGLGFTAQLQTLYLDPPAQTTTQGKRKNVQAITARVEQTRGIQLGANQPDASTQPNQANVPWANMILVKDRNVLIDAGTAVPLLSGDTLPILIPGEWDTRGQIAVQQIYPLPMTVNALIPQFQIGDNSG
jgi:hypothetical protein